MSKEKDEEVKTKDQNFELPKANVQRIIKKVIPDGISLVSDAKAAFSKSSVVFIMYLTAL